MWFSEKFLHKKESTYYQIALFALLAFVAYYVWQRATNLFFGFDDFSYHLAVAQGFVRAKGIVTWDFWESLPVGRPHNYPPLFHLFLAGLLKLNFSTVTIAKLAIESVVVGDLLIFFFGLKKLFNIKIAFWAVFFSVLSVDFVRMSATVLPSTIIIFCIPLLFCFLKKKKWLGYIALLVLLFYTHLFVPYIILFSFVIYFLIFDRKMIWQFILASAISFVFYLPWFLHVIFSGFSYIKYFDSNFTPTDNRYIILGINILVFLLVVTYLVSLKKLDRKFSKESTLFLILILVLLPFSYI